MPGGPKYGFLIENVQHILPELVKSEARSYMDGKNNLRTTTVQNVDIESLVPLLVGALKEQQEQIEELKRQVKALQVG